MAELYFKPFQDLIKQYSQEHVDVGHGVNGKIAFIRMETDEDVESLSSKGGPMLVIIDDFSGRTIGDADSRQYLQAATILFVKHASTGTGNNGTVIEDAQNYSEQVMLQFESRMWQDYNDDDCGPLKNLQWELTNYEKINGPVLENHFGWSLNIFFKAFKPAYSAAKWIIV